MIWKQFTHLEHFPPELETRFNSFLTTEFDDSLSVEMQFRSIIKWCQDNFKTVDTLIDFINDISKWLTEFEVRFGERLEEQVINVLEEWQQSGYINVVISEALQWQLDDYIETNEQDKLSINQQLEHTSTQLKTNIDGITLLLDVDDGENISNILSDVLNNVPNGARIKIPTGNYLFNSRVTITKPIHLEGDNVTLKTEIENFDVFLSFNDTNNCSVKGIKFDDNLLGRSVIDISNCTDMTIEENLFTGYSADYGWYQTDSAIRVSGISKRIYINKNKFIDFGNQYDTTGTTLNRCITINDSTCEQIYLKDNIFDGVNQAVVMLGDVIFASGNTMVDVRDNCFYILGASNVSIDNNYMENKHDEAIVMAGKNISIKNNTFVNIPNKSIAIAGDCDNLVLDNNTFDNRGGSDGQFIIWRLDTHTVTGYSIKNNRFLADSNHTVFEYFRFGNVIDFVFDNNVIDIMSAENQRIIFIAGTIAKGVFRNSKIKGTNDKSLAIDFHANVTDVDVQIDNVDLISCRARIGKMKVNGNVIQTNIGPYVLGKLKRTTYFNTSPPTNGSWQQGDICYNEQPLASGYLGWVCVESGSPGVWKGFGQIQS